jgi:membrane peptidoglycan carboxypeptidase
MNFQTILEELDRLYEATGEKAEEGEQEETALTEQEEIEVENDTAAEEEKVATEDIESADEEVVEDAARFVLECDNCGAITIKEEAAIKSDKDTELVNVGEVCQYCEADGGYKILGTLNPYVAEAAEEAVEEAAEEEPAEDTIDDETEQD